jgi:hypothetical protein
MVKARRSLVVLGLLASLTAIFGLGGTAFAAGINRNGTAPPKTTTYTKSGQETLTFDPKTCAALKAAFPKRASDPALCQHTHKWTETIILNSSTTSSDIAATCPSGRVSFTDYDSDYSYYILEMNTSFVWTGNCNQPVAGTEYGGEQCYPYLLIAGTTVSSPECYNYNYIGSYKSHADVYTVWVSFYVGPTLWLARWESQRRECKNASVGDCNWTSWIGK